MRRDLRAMTGDLSRLQAQGGDIECPIGSAEKEAWPIADPIKIL
jgi:hypothetical protein